MTRTGDPMRTILDAEWGRMAVGCMCVCVWGDQLGDICSGPGGAD